ncbi:DUF6283 family protein [Sphaerisporangium sp. NPDC049003]|uniref:DUF6283 family protein n=1 Tax=Sphaerisporangium sp. NPDC049003 TaxID=3364517 RepID=UPI003712689C
MISSPEHRTPTGRQLDLLAVVAELAELAALPVGVLRVREGADGWGVFTVISTRRDDNDDYQTSPCRRCPWRRDAPVGAFPPEVFRHSAHTAYDLAVATFGCHASDTRHPSTCAGFILRGAADNLTLRMRGHDYSDVQSDVDLYDNYQQMAIANGVDPDDPALAPCRGDRHGRIGTDWPGPGVTPRPDPADVEHISAGLDRPHDNGAENVQLETK